MHLLAYTNAHIHILHMYMYTGINEIVWHARIGRRACIACVFYSLSGKRNQSGKEQRNCRDNKNHNRIVL